MGTKRIVSVFFWTFVISGAVNYFSEKAGAHSAIVTSLVLLFLVISIGIIFDIIGTAATAATNASLNAMAAKRIKGSTQALWLTKRADSVANFCNDFVGDICGTLSGAIGVSLMIKVISMYDVVNAALLSAAGVALVSAITVGGKALGKGVAVNWSEGVLIIVGKIILFIEDVLKINLTKPKKHKK